MMTVGVSDLRAFKSTDNDASGASVMCLMQCCRAGQAD